MRDYSKVSPKFWIGKTGKALKKQGIETVVVGMYLLTAPHANMLGLYHVPLVYIAHETGLGMEGASKGLQGAIEAGFCAYDSDSEMVWVFEMAAYQIAERLKADDKRCIGVQSDYDDLPENKHLRGFYLKYAGPFNMRNMRDFGCPLEAPSKPLRSQEQEQEQEQEQKQASCTEPQSASTQETTGLVNLDDLAELDAAFAGGTFASPPAPAPTEPPATPPTPASASGVPQAEDDPAVLLMPLAGSGEFGISQQHIDGWVGAYPGVDVIRQLAAMRQWCIANPRKRKTRRGVLAFCNSWLMKEQDKAGGRILPPAHGGQGAPPPSHSQLGRAGQATARAVEELLMEQGHG